MMIARLEESPDGGYTATIDEMPGCITEGDDVCETLRNLAAAAALWSEDLVDAITADHQSNITLHTDRDAPGGPREQITCYVEPTEDETDPAQLRNLTLVGGGVQACVTHLSPETLTRLGLWLIDAAADAASKR